MELMAIFWSPKVDGLVLSGLILHLALQFVGQDAVKKVLGRCFLEKMVLLDVAFVDLW